jgi:hypothetical protein
MSRRAVSSIASLTSHRRMRPVLRRSQARLMAQDVIVFIGASSGYGRLSAEALALAGHMAYASMRETAEMDVQSQSSVDAASDKVFNANGMRASTLSGRARNSRRGLTEGAKGCGAIYSLMVRQRRLVRC